jgi:hypothetical protein
MDSTRRTRTPIVILGLAILFYFLTSISFEPMPFTSLPSWWMGFWPSRKAGVYTWFGMLNAAGALVAAVPVAILLRWLLNANRVRAAFFIGVITASVVAGSTVIKYPSIDRPTAFMAFELCTVLFLAVPFLSWILGALPTRRFPAADGRPRVDPPH